VKGESLIPYAALAVMGFLACARISGRPLSLMLRRPTIWDIVPIAFAVYMPVVGALIPNGFVASVVVVLSFVALWLVSRRFGPTRAEAAPPAR
jgi:hypothetical protein